MRSRIRSAWLVSLAFGSGCFGVGPVPSEPSEATIVYTIDNELLGTGCGASRYIGSVAIGAFDEGYLVTLPYLPQTNCDNGGGQPPQEPVSVETFQTAQKGVEVLGEAGVSDGIGPPRVAAAGMSGLWAYLEQSTGAFVIAPSVAEVSPNSPGATIPAGIVADSESIFVAGMGSFGGKAEVNNPNYPCCGPAGEGGGNGSLIRIPVGETNSPTILPLAPFFACDSMSECLVANTSSLFYAERIGPDFRAQITRFPKAGTSADEAVLIASIDSGSSNTGQITPVGLAANDTHVVWSASVEYELQGPDSPLPPPFCSVSSHDLATGESAVLLSTTAFSCMHVSLDADYAYFTIVEIAREFQDLRGVGIGRVSLRDQEFESLAHGIQDRSGGPRRVYVVEDSMYLVDAYAIARIETSALEGRHDFSK